MAYSNNSMGLAVIFFNAVISIFFCLLRTLRKKNQEFRKVHGATGTRYGENLAHLKYGKSKKSIVALRV